MTSRPGLTALSPWSSRSAASPVRDATALRQIQTSSRQTIRCFSRPFPDALAFGPRLTAPAISRTMLSVQSSFDVVPEVYFAVNCAELRVRSHLGAALNLQLPDWALQTCLSQRTRECPQQRPGWKQ